MIHLNTENFWKRIFTRLCVWNVLAVASFPFSKKVSAIIAGLGVLDLAYRFFYTKPAHPKKAEKRALRLVARLRPEVVARYAPGSNIGYWPTAVVFDQFPQLQVVPADLESLENPPVMVPALDQSYQNLNDEALSKVLMEIGSPLQLDLSGNSFTGTTLHAGFALPTTRIIMRDLDHIKPETLRKLETYPNLVELDLSGSRINDEALILGLYQIPPQLRILRLDNCTDFSSKTLEHLTFRQIQTLELLTLMGSTVDISFVEMVMKRAGENRVKPLLIAWKENGFIRIDLSPCSGLKEDQCELIQSIGVPYDFIYLHDPGIRIAVTWDDPTKQTAKIIQIQGHGEFSKIVLDFLNTFEWIQNIQIEGFQPLNDTIQSRLKLISDTLDIKP